MINDFKPGDFVVDFTLNKEDKNVYRISKLKQSYITYHETGCVMSFRYFLEDEIGNIVSSFDPDLDKIALRHANEEEIAMFCLGVLEKY